MRKVACAVTLLLFSCFSRKEEGSYVPYFLDDNQPSHVGEKISKIRRVLLALEDTANNSSSLFLFCKKITALSDMDLNLLLGDEFLKNASRNLHPSTNEYLYSSVFFQVAYGYSYKKNDFYSYLSNNKINTGWSFQDYREYIIENKDISTAFPKEIDANGEIAQTLSLNLFLYENQVKVKNILSSLNKPSFQLVESAVQFSNIDPPKGIFFTYNTLFKYQNIATQLARVADLYEVLQKNRDMFESMSDDKILELNRSQVEAFQLKFLPKSKEYKVVKNFLVKEKAGFVKLSDLVSQKLSLVYLQNADPKIILDAMNSSVAVTENVIRPMFYIATKISPEGLSELLEILKETQDGAIRRSLTAFYLGRAANVDTSSTQLQKDFAPWVGMIQIAIKKNIFLNLSKINVTDLESFRSKAVSLLEELNGIKLQPGEDFKSSPEGANFVNSNFESIISVLGQTVSIANNIGLNDPSVLQQLKDALPPEIKAKINIDNIDTVKISEALNSLNQNRIFTLNSVELNTVRDSLQSVNLLVSVIEPLVNITLKPNLQDGINQVPQRLHPITQPISSGKTTDEVGVQTKVEEYSEEEIRTQSKIGYLINFIFLSSVFSTVAANTSVFSLTDQASKYLETLENILRN